MTSDAELFDAWAAGDRIAGDRLLRRHFRSLYAFFANKVPDAAQDLVQRTMLACVKSRDRYRGEGSFRAYLLAVARNELYAHFRGKEGVPAFDASVTSAADVRPSPSVVVVARAEQRALLAALRRIPLELQIALELHYWEDLTTAELAVVLDVPVGTVKSRLRRARERLLAELETTQEADGIGGTDGLDRWAASIREELELAGAGSAHED
jgi:RNA polymerase sigma-70 factor (ECF subfamily)